MLVRIGSFRKLVQVDKVTLTKSCACLVPFLLRGLTRMCYVLDAPGRQSDDASITKTYGLGRNPPGERRGPGPTPVVPRSCRDRVVRGQTDVEIETFGSVDMSDSSGLGSIRQQSWYNVQRAYSVPTLKFRTFVSLPLLE